ncbi:hypothetical protein [Microvirus mar38]|uniref:Uncharacterized protein n=1 Tax=Microvirus mar38 TaxID=2851172 RepID=A0A8F5XPJ1_9VIRU|nr:hypothetical protein [Microvirus mar38]
MYKNSISQKQNKNFDKDSLRHLSFESIYLISKLYSKDMISNKEFSSLLSLQVETLRLTDRGSDVEFIPKL